MVGRQLPSRPPSTPFSSLSRQHKNVQKSKDFHMDIKHAKTENLSLRLKSWNLPVAVLFKHHSPWSLEVLLFLSRLKHHKMKPSEPSSCSRFHLRLKQNIIGSVGRLCQLPKAVLGDTYNFFQMKSNPGPSWCKNPEIFSAEKSKCQANWNVAGYLREDSGDFAGKMWKSARRGFIKCNLPPTIACGPLFNSKRSSCNIFRSQACSFLHPELGDGLGL